MEGRFSWHSPRRWMIDVGRPVLAGLFVLIGLIGSVSLGCSDEDALFSLPVEDRIARFLASQDLPAVHGFDELLVEPSIDLVLFRVRYGETTECSRGGCVRPSAFGLTIGERIGWVEVPAAFPADAPRFDIRPDDSFLFDQEFLVRVRSAGEDAYVAVRLMLARDPDTPEPTLALVAGSLAHGGGPPEIGLALLENPNVAESRPVLEALARNIHSFLSGWQEVYRQTWELLRRLLPPLEEIEFDAVALRNPQGELFLRASIENPTVSTFVMEYAGVCAPSLLVYRDPGLTGSLLWDQLEWWNSRAGGCKWLPAFLEIPTGVERHVSTPAMADADILGDSIPAGTYPVSMRLRILQPRDSTLVIPAGTVELGG